MSAPYHMSAMAFALLEEIDALLAVIELYPKLPFAHLAPRQAALAKHALETALDSGDSSDSTNSNILSLKILRAIAETTTATASTTLEDAVESGNIGLVWCKLEEESPTPKSFTCACRKGFIDIVRLLLERGADPAADDNAALCSAIRNGRTEIVRELLALPEHMGVDPAVDGDDTFQVACIHGFTDIVRMLLEVEMDDFCFDLNLALILACQYGHEDVVRLLLQKGAEPAWNNNSAFVWACLDERANIVRLLTESGRMTNILLSPHGSQGSFDKGNM